MKFKEREERHIECAFGFETLKRGLCALRHTDSTFPVSCLDLIPVKCIIWRATEEKRDINVSRDDAVEITDPLHGAQLKGFLNTELTQDRTNSQLEQVFPHFRVHSAEGIVKEVDVSILVDCPERQRGKSS